MTNGGERSLRPKTSQRKISVVCPNSSRDESSIALHCQAREPKNVRGGNGRRGDDDTPVQRRPSVGAKARIEYPRLHIGADVVTPVGKIDGNVENFTGTRSAEGPSAFVKGSCVAAFAEIGGSSYSLLRRRTMFRRAVRMPLW